MNSADSMHLLNGPTKTKQIRCINTEGCKCGKMPVIVEFRLMIAWKLLFQLEIL